MRSWPVSVSIPTRAPETEGQSTPDAPSEDHSEPVFTVVTIGRAPEAYTIDEWPLHSPERDRIPGEE